MYKREEKLYGLACFLGGMVVGFLIAPIKEGIYCGNNTGNTVGNLKTLKRDVDNSNDKKKE